MLLKFESLHEQVIDFKGHMNVFILSIQGLFHLLSFCIQWSYQVKLRPGIPVRQKTKGGTLWYGPN